VFAAADPARPEAIDTLDLHGADLRRDAHQAAIPFNADPAADPVRSEAHRVANNAAGVLVVDLDQLVDEPARAAAPSWPPTAAGRPRIPLPIPPRGD